MLPALAALAVAVPVLTALRIAGMGMCVYGHDSDTVDRHKQTRNTQTLGTEYSRSDLTRKFAGRVCQ